VLRIDSNTEFTLSFNTCDECGEEIFACDGTQPLSYGEQSRRNRPRGVNWRVDVSIIVVVGVRSNAIDEGCCPDIDIFASPEDGRVALRSEGRHGL
jgi:hypothetical protein